MTFKDAPTDLVAYVATASGGTLAAERDLFAGDGYPLPQGAVAQFLTAAGDVDPYVSGVGPRAHATALVQVLVYGMPGRDGYTAADTLARQLAGYLQQATVSGYVSVRLVNLPIRVGEAKAGRPVTAFTVQAEYSTA